MKGGVCDKSTYLRDPEYIYHLKYPLSDPDLLIKSTSKCEHCEAKFTS